MSGLYVHVPFCARACPYCDFDFQVGRSPATGEFIAGLERELDLRLALKTGAKGHGAEDSGVVPPGDAWPTVYLGGGTPSLLGPDGLRALGAFIARRFPGAGGDEYTVEVNPEHGDAALYEAVRAIGGTRVSLGIQTLDPEGLAALGRVHDAGTARKALTSALAAELAVSADLIVGWPGQSVEVLAADVTQLIDLGVRHVSVYALTIESGTPWETLVRRGKRRLPDPDHQADMLLAAEAALTGAGLEHYEVASYAAPGKHARHNLGYWTWQDYLGLGPSAHSAVYSADGSVTRRGNLRGLPAWQADPAKPGEMDPQDPAGAAAEGLWTGLRHLPGLDLAAFLARFPAVDRAWIDARTRKQVARGNLEFEGGLLRVAAGRWLWHDAVAADLLT